MLDSHDLSLCNKYGQALVDLTRQEAHETLQANDGRPVMLVYICDGWSARVRSDHRRQDQSGQKIVRQGRSRQEFLLQRGILRVGSAGRGEKLHMLFSAPRALHLGKTSWNVLTACAEFEPLLRASGHHGLCLTVYIQDGLLFSSYLRLFKARHSLFYDSELFDEGAHDALGKARDIVA